VTSEPAQFPNVVVACDEVHEPSGGNCNNGNVHVYCGGVNNTTCPRFVAVEGNFTQFAVYSVDYCDEVPCENLYIDYWNGSSWEAFGGPYSFSCPSYAYVYWQFDRVGYYSARKERFRIGSDINNPITAFDYYINYFYVTIHTQQTCRLSRHPCLLD